MAQTRTIVLGVVAVVAAIVGALYVITLFGNTETPIVLSLDANGACTPVTKDQEVRVKKNKKVTWKVDNRCTGKGEQKVSVGNFRLQQNDPPPPSACKIGMTETVWPFKDQDQDNRSATVPEGQTRNIKLRDAKNSTTQPFETYFDICVGAEKKDPRLVVDP